MNNLSHLKQNQYNILDLDYLKQHYSHITRALQLLNAIICIGLLLFLTSSPNVKMFIGNFDLKTGWVMLISIVVILIILITRPLLRVISNNLFVVIISFITLGISIYLLFSILNWYFTTIEDIVSFKGIKLVMSASYEAKNQLYFDTIKNIIPVISKDNLPLKLFLENNNIISNVLPKEFNSYLYQEIPQLARDNIALALQEYANIVSLKPQQQDNTSSSINSKMVIGVIVGLVVIGILIYYNAGSISKLAQLNKKSQDITSGGLNETINMNQHVISATTLQGVSNQATSEISKKIADSLEAMAPVVAQVKKTVSVTDALNIGMDNLEEKAILLTQNLKTIKESVIMLDQRNDELYTMSKYLFNFIINIYVPSLTDPVTAKAWLYKLPKEVKDFIT